MVHENFGTIESFEKTPTGVRMIFSKNADRVRHRDELVRILQPIVRERPVAERR